MDPLSDVLSLLKPQTYLTAGFDAGGDWAVQFGDQTGRIKCYAVTSGSCFLSVDGVTAPVRLEAGDCFVLPSGRAFRLGSNLDLPAAPADEVFAQPRVRGVALHNGGGDLFLAGARFEVDSRHAEAVLGRLPPIIHLRESGDRAAWRWSLDRLRDEVRDDRPGAALMAHHLAHMMLVQALRLYLSEHQGHGVGWFFALADPGLAAAIGAMHGAPGHRWTLAELATRAGMSRSVFAARFRDRVGETPVSYLTGWRMRLAAERLATTRDPLARIAQSLGYESENAFNTAFRRVMGSSPRRYGREGSRMSAPPNTI
jgi:AraC-like DNA-binding protein